jgi:hypothetical protein
MADTSTQAAPQKSPLDILEDILDNAEAQKEDQEALKVAQQQEAELKAREEEARQRDLAQLEQERAKMTELEHSPQAQARATQMQTKTEETLQKASDSQGFEIRQLGHTKI